MLCFDCPGNADNIMVTGKLRINNFVTANKIEFSAARTNMIKPVSAKVFNMDAG
jgi:hypothetical protein